MAMRIAALIAGVQGNLGACLSMFAYDFLGSQEQARVAEENRRIEEHNRKYAIAPHEHTRLFSWAIGENMFAIFNWNDQNNGWAKPTDAFECLIECWNEKHGNTLRLYYENGMEHNLLQIANLWINLGKPF